MDTTWNVRAKTLATAVRSVMHATGESFPRALDSIFMRCEDETMILAATDGHRLVEAKCDIEPLDGAGEKCEINVPHDTLVYCEPRSPRKHAAQGSTPPFDTCFSASKREWGMTRSSFGSTRRRRTRTTRTTVCSVSTCRGEGRWCWQGTSTTIHAMSGS